MKRPLPIVIGCLAGLAVGVLAGRQIGSAAHAPTARAPSGNVATAHDTSRIPEKVPVDKPRRDLDSLIRSRQQWERDGHSEIMRALERLGVAELKELIVGPSASEDEATPEERQAAAQLAGAACAELYRREGLAALEWAAELPASDERRRALMYLIHCAAREHPEITKPWMERFSQEFGDSTFMSFANAAIQGATSRGADALTELWELFDGKFGNNKFPQGRFADDFDFRQLVMELPQTSGVTDAVSYWAAKDAEAAWAGTKEAILQRDLSGGTVGAVYRGISTAKGEETAARWLAGALAELPDEKREQAVNSLMTYPLTPEATKMLMDSLADEPHRRIIAQRSVFPFNRSPGPAAAALERMPDAERVEIVAESARTHRQGLQGPRGESARDYFESLMDRLHFTPDAREQVRSNFPPTEP